MRNRVMIGLVAAGLASAAAAQAPSAADAIKARQQGMKSIGSSFKGMMDQVRGGSPDAAVVKRHAAALAGQSGKVVGWFQSSPATAPGVKTAALPAVWSDSAGFRKAAAAFDAEAQKTLAVANSGDMAAIGAQVRALGGTCKGCHDNFKSKDD